MTIRCICVDDEALARKGIEIALSAYPDFKLIGQYSSADHLMENIPEKIDVLFVDIEMPRTSGFEMLEQWPEPLPLVIFVTAYDQYAIRAFENRALDYLVKPIEEERFKKLVERIREMINQQKRVVTADQILQTVSDLKQKIVKQEAEICVKTDNGYFQIKLSDLIYLEAAGDHVCLHFESNQLITRYTLKKYLVELSELGFYQVHKSYMVNAKHVKQVLKRRFGDYDLELSNNTKLPLSRHYNSAIKHFI